MTEKSSWEKIQTWKHNYAKAVSAILRSDKPTKQNNQNNQLSVELQGNGAEGNQASSLPWVSCRAAQGKTSLSLRAGRGSTWRKAAEKPQ